MLKTVENEVLERINESSKAGITPELDETFIPAVLWNREFEKQVALNEDSREIRIGIGRSGESPVYVSDRKIFSDQDHHFESNFLYVERICKFLLWQVGGNCIWISGADEVVTALNQCYSESGQRAFDDEFIGEKIYGERIQFESKQRDEIVCNPAEGASEPLGRNLDGCRIGFDLGGSDRKCAAVIDGKVVFSEEIRWDPYFQTDSNYHLEGIRASINEAMKHLPRLDAIGGSAAGVYVDSKVRAGSLFRGVAEDEFKSKVVNIFHNLRAEYDIPFDVVNDGEVTALAGSMSLGKNRIMGISMGTSQAVGYINQDGQIMPWLNELAFAPVDYSPTAAIDEWSGDAGCGVQYFSQQAVGRLVKETNLDIEEGLALPEILVTVQKYMSEDHPEAKKIFTTIGTYFGYAIAHYTDFYDVENVLILGRVTSGKGGEIILSEAKKVLEAEFPEIAGKISFSTPNEKDKRHGQAIAAASLPKI